MKFIIPVLLATLLLAACQKQRNPPSYYEKKTNRGWFTLHMQHGNYGDTLFNNNNYIVDGWLNVYDSSIQTDKGNIPAFCAEIMVKDTNGYAHIRGKKLDRNQRTGIYSVGAITGNYYWVQVGDIYSAETYNNNEEYYAASPTDISTEDNNITITEYTKTGNTQHFVGTYRVKIVTPDTFYVWGEFDIRQ